MQSVPNLLKLIRSPSIQLTQCDRVLALAFAFLFVVFGVFAWLTNKESQGNPPNSAAQDQHDGARQRAVEMAEHSYTPESQPNSEWDHWRQKQDLEAQTSMSRSAFWTMAASFVSVLTAGVGIIVLLWTLKINQSQLIAAHRPWVSVDAKIISPMTFRNGRASIDIRFICKNIGGSPASKHMLYAKMAVCQLSALDNIKDVTDFARDWSKRDLKLNLPIADGAVLFHAAKAEITKHLILDAADITAFFDGNDIAKKFNAIYPTIVGCASYVSTIDQSYHQTGFIISICEVSVYSQSENGTVRFVENGEIPADGLTLQQLSTLSPPIY